MRREASEGDPAGYVNVRKLPAGLIDIAFSSNVGSAAGEIGSLALVNGASVG